MKRFLLFSVLIFASQVYGQIFQEDWDGSGPGIAGWTVIDVDANTPSATVASYMTDAWVVLDQGGTPNLDGPEGNFVAVSTSDYTPAGTSNDWLISPVIELPTGNISVFWNARAQDPNYRDGYELRLAPNAGNSPEDFTVTLLSVAEESSTWANRSASLNEYVGTSVRLAWVNNSTDKFLLLIDNILVDVVENVAPSCSALLSPADEAVGVDPQGIVLSWEASDSATSYQLFVGSSPSTLNYIDSVTNTSTPLFGLQYSTTYYWSIVPSNDTADAQACAVFSFTTMDSPFAPYCGPLVYYLTTEPITLVDFAGINNATSAEGAESAGHMDFTDQVGHVVPGETYTITLQGYTGGNYANRFVIFIDWNQNGVLDDAGEVYEVTQELVNSTGTDGQQVTHEITVPANALIGETRMRVKKQFGPNYYTDPCMAPGFGQAADYTLQVGSLSVGEQELAAMKIYPNPVKDVLHIQGDAWVEAKIYNYLGQQIHAKIQGGTVQVSHLSPGNYVLQLQQSNGEIRSFKFIKR
ncbi:MAG: choice-of-anchor J domain-containing protein [Weeksellaceae bacterium]|nr:choice-of-anchor J domain-containing protein [Weeksellaceae bacterium]